MDGLGHALDIAGMSELVGTRIAVCMFEVDGSCRFLLSARQKLGVWLSEFSDVSGIRIYARMCARCVVFQRVFVQF